MTKRCVVCGEKARHDTSSFCKKHGAAFGRASWPQAAGGVRYIARQVRANERRRYRELLRAAEVVSRVGEDGYAQDPMDIRRLSRAVQDAKARRSR